MKMMEILKNGPAWSCWCSRSEERRRRVHSKCNLSLGKLRVVAYIKTDTYSVMWILLFFCQQVNGVNVMRIPSRDAYSFGLQLLNILFTKEELAVSLLFKSKKGEKPGPEQRRVENMLRLIEKRFENDWDLRTLSQKVNQKCRDSSKDMHAPMQA